MFDTMDELLSLAATGSASGADMPLLDDPIVDADLLQLGGLYRGLFGLEVIVIDITPVPERTFYVRAQNRSFVVRAQDRTFKVKR